MGTFTIHFTGTICHLLASSDPRALLPDGRTWRHPHNPWLVIRKKDRESKPDGFEPVGDCWFFPLDRHEVGFTNVVNSAPAPKKKFLDAITHIGTVGAFTPQPACLTDDPAPFAVAYFALNGSLDACFTKKSATTGKEKTHRYAEKVYLDGDTTARPELFIRKFSGPISSAQLIEFDTDKVEVGLWNVPAHVSTDNSHFELHYRLFNPDFGPVPVDDATFTEDDCRAKICAPPNWTRAHILSSGPGCANSGYP